MGIDVVIPLSVRHAVQQRHIPLVYVADKAVLAEHKRQQLPGLVSMCRTGGDALAVGVGLPRCAVLPHRKGDQLQLNAILLFCIGKI